jgi:hypothetical protein
MENAPEELKPVLFVVFSEQKARQCAYDVENK